MYTGNVYLEMIWNSGISRVREIFSYEVTYDDARINKSVYANFYR